jgi:hypothetical protein
VQLDDILSDEEETKIVQKKEAKIEEETQAANIFCCC